MAKMWKRTAGKFAVFFGVLFVAGLVAQGAAPLLGSTVAAREATWFGVVFTAVGILGGLVSILVLVVRKAS